MIWGSLSGSYACRFRENLIFYIEESLASSGTETLIHHASNTQRKENK
jgi:hypothetical protein